MAMCCLAHTYFFLGIISKVGFSNRLFQFRANLSVALGILMPCHSVNGISARYIPFKGTIASSVLGVVIYFSNVEQKARKSVSSWGHYPKIDNNIPATIRMYFCFRIEDSAHLIDNVKI